MDNIKSGFSNFLFFFHKIKKTTNKQWFKNIEIWRNGPWEELNAIECEKFVDDAFKTYNASIKFFKEKDIQGVLKIA